MQGMKECISTAMLECTSQARGCIQPFDFRPLTENRRKGMSRTVQIVMCHRCDAEITVSGNQHMNPPRTEPEMSARTACGFQRDSPNCCIVKERHSMRGVKFLLLAAALLAPLALVPRATAQVTINIGAPPVCSYGYYDYAPYACSPSGYYGPGYFYNGIFLGIGPWENWGYHHGWGSHRFHGSGGGHYNPGHGYSGGGGSADTHGHAAGYSSGSAHNSSHTTVAHTSGGTSHNNTSHTAVVHTNGGASHNNSSHTEAAHASSGSSHSNSGHAQAAHNSGGESHSGGSEHH